MSMSLGNTKEKADINITPMIDVLLVLIIIFMVITPVTPQGLKALVPQGSSAVETQRPPAHEIVVTIRGDGTYLLNQEPLVYAELETRLARLFRSGAPDVVFVRAEKNIEFRQVAEVIDMARGEGVYRVALMPY